MVLSEDKVLLQSCKATTVLCIDSLVEFETVDIDNWGYYIAKDIKGLRGVRERCGFAAVVGYLGEGEVARLRCKNMSKRSN